MAKEEKTSDPMKASAAMGIEQARKAATDYFGFVRDSAAKTPWAGTHHALKMIDFAEQNLLATFDLAEELTRAKSFADLAQVQTAFVRKQMEAFGEQSRVLTEAGVKATTDLFKFPSK